MNGKIMVRQRHRDKTVPSRGFLEAVRSKIEEKGYKDAQLREGEKLNKGGCRLVLKNVPRRRIIVDCDRLPSVDDGGHRCDYLFFSEPDDFLGKKYFAPIEFKGGQIQPRHVVRQLKAGSLLGENLITNDKDVQFRPLAVYKRMNGSQRREMKKIGTIQFCGQDEDIRLVRSATNLMENLER